MEVTRENFWDTMDQWAGTEVELQETAGGKYCGHTDLHEKIYQECLKCENWTHQFDTNDYSGELKFRITTLSGAPMERWEFLKEVQFNSYGDGLAAGADLVYHWAVPTMEEFPSVYEFMDANREYVNPLITRLGPGHQIMPHNHGPQVQWLFNMSINEPEGSRNAIYPQGILPYKPGDIYQLFVHNLHGVWNGNGVRYHLLFRGGR